jgi:OOP family OmpA-OmpF porin
MASLIQLVQDTLTPDIVGRVSGMIGETPATTDSALRRAVPAVLAGVLNNASTPAGAERMCSLITDGGWGSDLLNNLGSRLGGGSGTSSLLNSGAQLISSLFGNKTDGITDLIASGSGASRGSASTLLSVAAPIVMSVLDKQMASRGLGASGLSALLAGERTSLLGALPAGVIGLLGLKDSVLTGDRAEEAIPREPTVREPILRAHELQRSGIGNWWPALLAGLAALAFLIFLVSRGQRPEVASSRVDTTPSAAPRQLASITLPDGAKLSVGEGSPVYQLSSFLADLSASDLPKRFVFDDLHFESGTTRLTPEGERTAAALLSVLKAYPSVEVVLEGHTDATGDAAANKALSQQRAEVVKRMLVDGGVAADRIEAEGYGQERPLADNDTDAGRARNRRLELVVTHR